MSGDVAVFSGDLVGVEGTIAGMSHPRTRRSSPRPGAIVLHVVVLLAIYGWLYWTSTGYVVGANIGQDMAGLALLVTGLPWSLGLFALHGRVSDLGTLVLLSVCALGNLAIHVALYVRRRRRNMGELTARET